jgi:hypothetical protein
MAGILCVGKHSQRIDASQQIDFRVRRYVIYRCASANETRLEEFLSPSADNLQLFQMDRGIDKIARRSANCGNKRLFSLTYH